MKTSPESAPEERGQDTGQLAARVLNQLFRTRLHEDGREYTHKEVEKGIAQIYGRKMLDASYISKLRNGHIQSPSIAAIEAICVFFEADPLSFFPRLSKIKREDRSEYRKTVVAFRRHFNDLLEELDRLSGEDNEQ
jgi:transcriptional regulator with XRE-family HTH domain